MARDCLGRIPFPSLIATIVCCLGVGLFCGFLARALVITLDRIFSELFNLFIPWLQVIFILFIVISVVMGIFALILLTFGFLATGATRENVYSGTKCIMGGRVSAGFFMILSYVLNLVWMVVTSFSAMPILIYIMLRSICLWEIENKEEAQLWGYCLNLTRFGIYVWNDTTVIQGICDPTQLGRFCQHTHDAGWAFIIAFIGSILVVCAMILFLNVLSSNYQKLKMTKELTEFREAVDMEMREASVYGNERATTYSIDYNN